jgi:hypothetical protein
MARYILFMKPNISAEAYGEGPSADAAERMGAFNQELQDAGVLLALDGLAPPSEGARVRFSGGTPTVTDGPFAEAKELIGGYWIIQAKDKAEAIEWARRVPDVQGDEFEIEVRRIYDMEDFAEDVQEAATLREGEPPAQPLER